jgi:hypothetical protein
MVAMPGKAKFAKEKGMPTIQSATNNAIPWSMMLQKEVSTRNQNRAVITLLTIPIIRTNSTTSANPIITTKNGDGPVVNAEVLEAKSIDALVKMKTSREKPIP